MARAKQQELKYLNTWWVRAVMAVIFLGVAYGFVSLAIDSGSLLEYAVGIGFFIWALRCARQAIRAH